MLNRRFFFLPLILILIGCDPSAEEKRLAEIEQQRVEQEASEKLAQEKAKRIAAVTCSIMGETRKMDSAIRVREMNNAREKIGGEPFLSGDSTILEAFEWGLCLELVLDENYDETLQPLKDAKRERELIAAKKLAEETRIAAEKLAEERRIAAEKLAEERRIAAEKLAEEKRIAAEKQRIADSKPTVEEEFFPDGKLKSRTNFQPKSDGGMKHGFHEEYFATGEIMLKFFYKNGKRHGLQEKYYKSGQVWIASNYVDGSQEGITEWFHPNGQVSQTGTWKDDKKEGLHLEYRENGNLQQKTYFLNGKAEGLEEAYLDNGRLRYATCYRNGRSVNKSYCKK